MPHGDQPGPRTLALASACAGLVCMGLRALMGAPLGEVHGSTGAWLMAQVQRTEWLDSFPTAALVGELPNLVSNPLYPALVALLSPGPEQAVWVGQLVAAGALGPALVALWLLWRPVVGPVAAMAGAAALFLPSMTATAAQARYDSLAMALGLWAVAAAAEAGRSRGRAAMAAWATAGALASLSYLSREYLGLVAVGVVGILGGLSAVRGRWRGPLLAAAQVVLVASAVSLMLGLHPLGGLDNILRYSGTTEVARPVFHEVLGPSWHRALLAAGGLGWGLAVLGRERGALLPLGLLMAPFAAFAAFPQQSPQYYLLGQVLLVSGLAGLVARIPSEWGQRGGAGVVLVGLLAASAAVAPRLVLVGSASGTGLHSEAWSDDGPALHELVDLTLSAGGRGPVVLSTQRVENLDAFAELRHRRPVGFVFPNDLARIDDFLAAFEGAEVSLALVDHTEQPQDNAAIDALGEPELTRQAGDLRLRLWTLPGRTSANDPCTWETTLRGFCTQRNWLSGGVAGMQRGAWERRARVPGLLRAQRR